MSLAQLPIEQGIRLRGVHVTRLENFVDASFAFALTLLVISSNSVPTSMADLVAALWRIPTFAVCFLLLTMYWSAHHRFCRRFGLDDRTTRKLSLLLVFVVLIYVYPLRVLLSVGLASMSGGLLPTEIRIEHVSDLEIAFIVYAIGILVLSLIIVALNRHVLRLATTLALDARERTEVQLEIKGFAINAGVAIVSLLLACWVLLRHPTDDRFWPGLPGFVYGLLAIIMPLFGMHANRLRSKFASETAAPP